MQAPGHLGMALLFTAPVWRYLERRRAVAFTAAAATTAMLPDVDLVLPVSHHGVTHTLLFVLVASAAIAVAANAALHRCCGLTSRLTPDDVPSTRLLALGVVAGGGSHLVTDMLSAPDIAPPIEPLWPLFSLPFSVDVIRYDSVVANVGVLVLGVLVQLAFFRAHRRRARATAT